MIFLDTSSLIRFFTEDKPKKALLVKELLEEEEKVSISEVVFPELEYVLEKTYKTKREKIVEAFKFLASRPNIKLSKSVKKAIGFFEETKLDMADCLIAAHSLKGKLASFDKKLLSMEGVIEYW